MGRNWEKREEKYNQDILSEGKVVFNKRKTINLKKREREKEDMESQDAGG